jgi:hypothetical protein
MLQSALIPSIEHVIQEKLMSIIPFFNRNSTNSIAAGAVLCANGSLLSTSNYYFPPN